MIIKLCFWYCFQIYSVGPQLNPVNVHRVQVDNVDLQRHSVDVQRHSVDPQVNLVDPQLNSVDPQLNSVDPQLNRVDPQLNRVDPQLNDVDPQLNAVDPQLNPVDPQLNAVDPQLNPVDNFKNNDEENVHQENVEGNSSEASTEGNWLSYSQLMLDSYPAKSKIIYLKAYKMFERYLKSQNQFVPNVAPSEIQILNFFHFLKHEKNLAPTTLWSTYSRVNACVKRLYGFSLKSYVRVTDVLKSYESGYKVKKASIFSPQEVYII